MSIPVNTRWRRARISKPGERQNHSSGRLCDPAHHPTLIRQGQPGPLTTRTGEHTMYLTTREHMLRAATHRAQGEILQDIAGGRFAAEDVRTFSDLHTFVDANEYGGLTDSAFMSAVSAHVDTVDDEAPYETAFANDVIRTVDLWLRSGAHREPCMGCGYPLQDEDGEGATWHLSCVIRNAEGK